MTIFANFRANRIFLIENPFLSLFSVFTSLLLNIISEKNYVYSKKNWLPTHVCTDGRTDKQEFVNSPFEGPRTNKQNLKI